jgi:hypothetical protein
MNRPRFYQIMAAEEPELGIDPAWALKWGWAAKISGLSAFHRVAACDGGCGLGRDVNVTCVLGAKRMWKTLSKPERRTYRFIETRAPRGTTYDRAKMLLSAEARARADRTAALEAKIAARLDK